MIGACWAVGMPRQLGGFLQQLGGSVQGDCMVEEVIRVCTWETFLKVELQETGLKLSTGYKRENFNSNSRALA